MSRKQIAERTLALAGVLQAAQLADQFACNGEAAQDSTAASIGSLFVFDPVGVKAVFNGVDGVQFGLRTLCSIAAHGPGRHRCAVSYAQGMVRVAQQLRREDALSAILRQRLQSLHRAGSDTEDFDELCIGLDDLYRDTLSTMAFRIRLRGNRRHLSDSRVVHQLRALMLAGVRAAMLWRQVGGSYLRLFMERKHMERTARKWLEHITDPAVSP